MENVDRYALLRENNHVKIQSVTAASTYSVEPGSTRGKFSAVHTDQTVQDSVQLSPQAKASLDVDHDGDSR
jgi:hypothetical protein